MLESLRRIVQDVNTAPSLQASLDIMVSSVRQAMGTQVCSVYLLDDKNSRYVLMATEGLNAEAIGHVSLGVSEGLVGQVGLREEPLNLDDASAHPKFHYLPETGEERYNSFLGVPIMHRRKILGVLVVQQRDKRKFDESEEAFLVTVSAQLSGVVAHARAVGALDTLRGKKPGTVGVFNGVVGSHGVGIGRAYVVYPPAQLNSIPDRSCENTEDEIALLQEAVAAVRQSIMELDRKMVHTLMPEERALFDVYLRMLDDHGLVGEIIERIVEGNWAQGALRMVIEEHVQAFQSMEDAYLRERMADVRDLGLRVLAQLQKNDAIKPFELKDHTILVGEDISTSVLVEQPLDKIAGIATVQGSSNAHMAIVARALGIPAVVGLSELSVTSLDETELIVDGYQGRLYVNPSSQLKARYKDIIRDEQQFIAGLDAYKDKPARTVDGHEIQIMVNTGLMVDVARSRDRGAEGVGLYRSEIPFMMRERFPSEEEQRAIYRFQLESFAPRPVTMRTLDIGGDKDLPYFPIEEENPALGWRGIRVTLDHPEIFMVQLRAMLKASCGLNNLRILFPMISSVVEIEEALHLLHRAVMEVEEELNIHLEKPMVGIMLEVPAAVIQVADMAQLVDFVSVGSNDLTQYILAVDRNNPRVADIYSAYHPAVLRTMHQIVRDVHAVGRKVSVCGEMAGDPGTAMLLMAMGYDTLSMSSSNLLRIKKLACTMNMSRARALLERVLMVDSAAVIRSLVEYELEEAGLISLIKPIGQTLDSES